MLHTLAMQETKSFRKRSDRPQLEISQLPQRGKHLRRGMQVFRTSLWIMVMMMMVVPMTMVVGQGTPNTTTASPPAATGNAGTPPPTTTKAAAPPISTVSATAPKAAPPVITAATAPPPKPTPVTSTPPKSSPPPASSPPPTATAPPPTKPTSTPPSPSTNLTSPPPTAPPPKSTPPPLAPPPKSPPPSLPPTPAPAPAPTSPPELDISQLAALRELKVPFNAAHPCKTSSDILLCDKADPPHHLTSLSLRDCPHSTNFTTAALSNLTTLQNLELTNCSVKPVDVPGALRKSLTTFICSESLGRTGTNEKANKLSGMWLAKLTSLHELSVTDVELSASGLLIIVKDMKDLTQLVVSRTNLPGVLPRTTWPQDIEYIDVSGNSIRGTLPSQMQTLSNLKHLDLSDNQIKGVLPNIFSDLQQLQHIDLSGNQFSGPIPGSLASLRNCSHLDLSNNQLNGSIPANLTRIRTLRYLDLSQNELSGPIPFNSTFLNRLTTLKLGQNSGLCYNHTALKSKFLTGIRNCVSVAADTSLFAPAPAPAIDNLSRSSKSGGISKGAAAGISITVIAAAAAIVFVARKWWNARDDGDQFENLRAQRERP